MATILDTLITRIGPEFIGKGELRKLESAVGRMQAKLDSVGSSALRMGTAVTASTVAIAAAGIETDKALRTLEARSGATADELERFKRQAYEIGSQLPLNTADIIRAQTAFVQLGNSIRQAVAATPGIARFAVGAEGVGIEDSARYASIALRAFGLNAEDTQLVLDQMLLAETKTAAAARDIGEAFRFSAQSAADAGLGTQSFIAILGTLAGSGRSAEESSQGLNVLLTKLSKGMSGVGRGGKMVTDVLEKIGLSGEDVERAFAKGEEGIFDFLASIKTATAGNAALRTSVLAALVGESYASAFSFLIENIDDARATFVELGDAAGESARQSAIQMKGLSGAWESVKAQIDTVRNVLSDTGVGVWVERLLRTAADLMAELTRVGDSGEYVHGRMLKLISAASLAGPALLALGVALKGISIALGGLVPIASAIAWIGRVTGITTAAQWAWNAAVGAGPRIAAAASAAMLSLQAVGVAAATALNVAWSRLYLTLKFAGVKGLVLSLWAAISAAGVAAFTAVKVSALSAFTAIKGGAVATFAAIKGLTLAGLWAGIKAVGVAAFVAVKGAAVAAFAALGAVSLPVIAAIAAAALVLIAAWKPVSSFFRGLWTGVTGNLGQVGEAFGRLLDALGPVGGAVRDVFGFLRDALGWLANMLPDLTAEGESVGAGIVRGMAAAIDAITAVIEFIRGISLADAGAALMRTLVDGIMSAKDWIVSAVTDALGAVRDLLPFSDARIGPLSRLTQSGRAIVTTIAEGVQSAPTTLTDALRDALPKLPELAIPDMPELRAAIPDLPSLDALAPPLPIGPVPPPAAAGATSLTITLGEGAIVINAPGGDAEQIAERIGGELENQWRALAEQVDSRFRA